MSGVDQSSRLMLTGHLPFVLLAAAVIALPVALLLLHLYKRAVVRSMQRGGANPDAAAGVPVAWRASSPRKGTKLQALALGSPPKAAAIYAFAGLAYAFLMSLATQIAGGISVSPERLLIVAWNYAWPAALSVTLVATPTWRGKAVIVCAYFAVLCAGAFAGLNAAQIVSIWIFANFGPTLLLLLFLSRPVRAVGPLVFTFALVAVVGCELALDAVAYDVRHDGLVAKTVFAAGLNAFTYLSAVAIGGFALFSVLGWFAMRRIGRRYEAKKVTDQSMTLDALWIVFAIVHGIFLSLNGAPWALAAIVAFAAYKAIVAIGFRLWHVPSDFAPRLLILRVFSLGRRSQRMFNAIAQHWRYAGTLQLIAGPDLATSTIEPHEFLAFLGGRLSRRFVSDGESFRQRLAELDLRRDFDRRFRVNDFFCQNNSWQSVLKNLLGQSDAVLMDLRGFSRANGGCVFELQELARLTDGRRVVFVTDRTTDAAFLKETLGHSADRFGFLESNGGRGEVSRIVRALCSAAEIETATTV